MLRDADSGHKGACSRDQSQTCTRSSLFAAVHDCQIKIPFAAAQQNRWRKTAWKPEEYFYLGASQAENISANWKLDPNFLQCFVFPFWSISSITNRVTVVQGVFKSAWVFWMRDGRVRQTGNNVANGKAGPLFLLSWTVFRSFLPKVMPRIMKAQYGFSHLSPSTFKIYWSLLVDCRFTDRKWRWLRIWFPTQVITYGKFYFATEFSSTAKIAKRCLL